MDKLSKHNKTVPNIYNMSPQEKRDYFLKKIMRRASQKQHSSPNVFNRAFLEDLPKGLRSGRSDSDLNCCGKSSDKIDDSECVFNLLNYALREVKDIEQDLSEMTELVSKLNASRY
ncbi:uncharacterized protein LOC123005564 [Tribolium madens]|uniref:uncharacterized protein LOC123005564 n=1 Tax=Tribolium madens TaxID=41895 RepID=UPI001CF74F04|nr:uncharacterized protein LOC123005564 [Tribolium madens]